MILKHRKIHFLSSVLFPAPLLIWKGNVQWSLHSTLRKTNAGDKSLARRLLISCPLGHSVMKLCHVLNSRQKESSPFSDSEVGMCYKTKLTSVSRLVTWMVFSCRIWNKLNLKIKLGTERPLYIIPSNDALWTHRTDFKEMFLQKCFIIILIAKVLNASPC